MANRAQLWRELNKQLYAGPESSLEQDREMQRIMQNIQHQTPAGIEMAKAMETTNTVQGTPENIIAMAAQKFNPATAQAQMDPAQAGATVMQAARGGKSPMQQLYDHLQAFLKAIKSILYLQEFKTIVVVLTLLPACSQTQN